jgi:hypothetical protein
MPLPWIKMWLEALDDPKLTRLSLAERGAWWGVLKLAGKCNANGKIVSGGQGLNIDDIADALHIKTSDDRQALESMVTKMEQRGSLKWNDDALVVVRWEERQRIPPSLQPEAIAERVRRHREGRKKTEVAEVVEVAKESPEAGVGKGSLPLTSQDDAVLRVWSGVKGFPRDSNEATRFLATLRAEFPDIDILAQSKKWAAAKLSKPLTKRSLPFKQLWAWMNKEREFAEERRASGADKRHPGAGKPEGKWDASKPLR